MTMIPTLDNGIESLLAVSIHMDELDDNETKEDKWCDIWLVVPETMICLSEDIFGDDVSWDCKAMLACS